MQKSFFILSLMATTILSANAEADEVNCYDYCRTAGNSCTTTTDGCRQYYMSAAGWVVYYKVDGTNMTVYGPETGEPIALPNNSFNNNYNVEGGVTHVEFSGQINSLGANTFSFRSNLTSVTLPDTLSSIGNASFANTGLTSISIPDTVTTIEGSAFARTHLTSVTIPDSVTSIGDNAFISTGLTNVTIPDNVTSIGGYAFTYTSLTSIVIPDSVTSIGDRAFMGVPNTAVIYCQNSGHDGKSCSQSSLFGGTSFQGTIQEYTKDNKGVYWLVDSSGNALPNSENPMYYASAEDMQTGSTASCGSYDACLQKVDEYKQIKAAELAQRGVVCQTKTGCLKLMDMVSDTNITCLSGVKNSIANCSAYAKANNIALNDPDPVNSGNSVGGNGGSGGSSNGSGKRIYTVEEARQAVEAAGTETVNFRIRYK